MSTTIETRTLQTLAGSRADLEKSMRLSDLLQHARKHFPRLEIPQLFQHDTFEIRSIYLNRPKSLALMNQSEWFLTANKLHDWELMQAASIGDMQAQLIAKCYIWLPLEILELFNQSGKQS